MKHTNITYTRITQQENENKAYQLWKGVVNDLIEEKREIKGQKINNMEITGIGQKCIKLENNFIKWEDIFNHFYYENEETTTLDEAILEFIFEDYKAERETETYTRKTWKRSEAIENFDAIKEEIIQNKLYYKTGKIAGIGEKAVMYTYDHGFYNEYVNWDDVKETLTKTSIKDYIAMNKRNHMALTLEAFFVDDEEETMGEKQLKEQEDEYAEQKAYIYRHIIAEDLTLENIRKMVFNSFSYSEAEEIIKELMNFAFKYVKEIKFTDDSYDEEESNKYAVQSKDGYFYVIKNKEIEYNEEKQGYTFKEYKKAVFKTINNHIQVLRKGKVVYDRPGGIKAFLVGVRKHSEVQIAFELSPAQQVEILRKEGQLKEVTDDEIQAYFIKTVQSEYSEIGNEIKETIEENYKEDIRKAYTEYESIQAIAKEIYKEGRIHAGLFYTYLNAVASEPKIDKNRIVDFVAWDDSSTTDSILYDDKYGFNETYTSKDVTLRAGFNSKTYTYTENAKYTKIEHSSAHIDSFSVETVYIKGHITEQEIPHYLEYAYGMWAMRNTLKYGFLYEETLKNGGTFSYKL